MLPHARTLVWAAHGAFQLGFGTVCCKDAPTRDRTDEPQLFVVVLPGRPSANESRLRSRMQPDLLSLRVQGGLPILCSFFVR